MIEKKRSEQDAIGDVVERLTHKYSAVPPLTVADIVHKMHAKFDGRPVRDFVPLFVERNATSELAKVDA
ncbi:MAG: hypothetical protein JWP83_1285 [Mycobacterium sp.]|uniref:three-helix bundle dimerization domain-containing protein n=1 Tax=Mycobacterium sp. TaxID=1785 RepID=UPI002620B554|nr:hypothetical protein [Mycobacterium sp.]MCW2660133.1 hypothetical protein [Mycobacterium sp.]